MPALWRSPAVLPAIILIAAGLLVASESLVALAIVVLEALTSIGLLAAAALAGMWLVPIIGLIRESWRDRLMLGAGLGIGTACILVLVVGALGLIRPGLLALAVVLVIAALLRAVLDIRRAWLSQKPVETDASAQPPDKLAAEQSRRQALALSGYHYLWLLAAPFLAITVLAATLPPGILWREEAWGYDVLEYHLAVPKEFYEAGRIFFMPYNVYSNFPLNSEMLSLFTMALRGDPIEAALAAQVLNVGLALLFVAAAWWTARTFSTRAGITAGVLAAITPWITYLAGIAYVEPGMLALGMLALGAMLRAVRSDTHKGRWAIAAGLLAGFSCGFKYTAIPLIAAPIAILPLFNTAPWASRFKQIGLFTAAALLAFSPWMIRNWVNTGNPLFPLAYSVFGARPGVWDAELQARWEHGHGRGGAALDSGKSILKTALDRTLIDIRLGPVLCVLALIGAIKCRDRWTLAFLLMLAIQAAIWFSATHLFARFAVIFLLPLLLLAARLAGDLKSRWTIGAVVFVVTLSAAWNLYQLTALYYIHTRMGPEARSMAAHGHLNWFVSGEWPGVDYLKIVNALENHPRVMFVGEARTFYVRPPREYAVVFNHHPLAEAVKQRVGPAEPGTAPPGDAASTQAAAVPAQSDYHAVIRWLHDRGVTHVLVHWLELARLRGTYGLDPQLTPELFDQLESAGLMKMGDFMLDDNGMPYATLYEVPHE